MIITFIILLAIGFASISTTLSIKSTAKVSTNKNDFDVIFTSAMIDKLVVSNQVISEDM